MHEISIGMSGSDRDIKPEASGSRRMLTDEQIMAAIAAGDRRIYADTVRQHSRAIAFYAWRMLGSQAEAEDVVQETFLRLWTQAARWQPDRAGISTWLHRVAHNLCIDHMRKDRSAVTDELDEDLEDHKTDPDEDLDMDMRQRRLQQAIAALPERQRSALILVHYQGLSNQAVAGVMDLSVDALESLLARARRTLKASLADLRVDSENKDTQAQPVCTNSRRQEKKA